MPKSTVPVDESIHTVGDPKPDPGVFGTDPDHSDISSSSIMAPAVANETCDPFNARDQACTLGNMVVYSVNASEPSDFSKAIVFAKEKNIRLVIRNTGHEYDTDLDVPETLTADFPNTVTLASPQAQVPCLSGRTTLKPSHSSIIHRPITMARPSR